MIYVFATKGGSPRNPDWYHNLTAGGPASVELGTSQYPVTVAEVQGEARDRIYGTQASLNPGFAEYEAKTAGIRKIPVLALRRT